MGMADCPSCVDLMDLCIVQQRSSLGESTDICEKDSGCCVNLQPLICVPQEQRMFKQTGCDSGSNSPKLPRLSTGELQPHVVLAGTLTLPEYGLVVVVSPFSGAALDSPSL